jgi:RNA polymerase sigma-70 factor (ECF subfamily)
MSETPSAAPTAQTTSSTQQAVVGEALSRGYDRLRAYLVRRLGNAADAEDVLHGVILRAMEKAEALRNEDAVQGWLSRIVASAIVDHHRRQALRRRNETELLLQQGSPDPIGDDSDASACECVHLILPALNTEYAEVIRRIDLEAEDRFAAAAALGLTANALTVRLHRARGQLRQRLLEMCRSCREDSFLRCGC